jgi:hypothetical protein
MSTARAGSARWRQWTKITWRYWMAPGLTAIGTIVILPPAATVPCLIGGFLVAGAASYITTRDEKIGQLRLTFTQAELAIMNILQNVFPVIEHFEEELPRSSNLRACIMMPIASDEVTDSLMISYYSGAYSRLELEMVWHKGQGLAGICLEQDRVVLCPEEGMLPYELHGNLNAKWNMTDDQTRAVAGRTKTAFAFPLKMKETQKTRAILVLEDRRGPEDSDLRRTGVQALLEKRVVAPIEEQLNLTQFNWPARIRDVVPAFVPV